MTTEALAARPASLPPPGASLVVVEASAGTGKTYFLEHRVVDLILAGARLEQILLVTFTEKAVAELRLRIRDLLDRLARTTATTSGTGAANAAFGDAATRHAIVDVASDTCATGDAVDGTLGAGAASGTGAIGDATTVDGTIGAGTGTIVDATTVDGTIGVGAARTGTVRDAIAVDGTIGGIGDATTVDGTVGADELGNAATGRGDHVAGDTAAVANRPTAREAAPTSIVVRGDTTWWVIDAEARRRLRAAVTSFDQAPIFTIHGFCHRILVEDAFAAQRLFEQTQVADEVAFDTAFAALLRERFARVSPDRELLEAFLASGRTVDKLRDVLLECARAGHDARVRRRLDPEAVRLAADALREQLGTQGRRNIVQAALASERRWVPAWLDQIAHALDRCPADADPPRLVTMLDEVREPAMYLAKRADRLPAEIASALRRATSAITLDEAIAAELLPALLARIGDDKAEHGLFDYDDMLELVWRALCGPRREALAARLRERMPWVMIDEFQDTDPVQWNIFRTVWMHPDARGLTIVGDPKQAIYGFRGADVQTYVAAREEMLRAGAVRVSLAVNRRSTEALVEAINHVLVGNPLMPLLDKTIRYDEPVRASGDVEALPWPRGTPPAVTMFVLQSIGRGQTDANKLALAGAIGDAIERLRTAAPVWRLRGIDQPFALGQIMVLGRTNRDSTEIAVALRARGLPCSLVEPEKLFDTREASELACVLAAVAAPRDRSARMRALRTRFFDVPWGDLQQVVDAPDHHPLIARLFDWAQLAARRGYESLFRKLVEDSRYAERALVLGGGERALTNTWHLIELLLGEVARSRCDLHELVVQLRRWIADDAGHPDERDIQRAAIHTADSEAIRVLTIHKAKGLEAPYVFLYGGTSGGMKSGVHMLRTGGAGRAIVVGTPDDDTQRLLDDEIEAENQRLAYVALTRAQVRLYLPFYGEMVLHQKAAYQPIQRCIAPLVGGRASARLPRPGLFEQIAIEVGAPARPPAPPDALADFHVPEAPAATERVALAPARRGLAMVSYTRLAHDIDTAAIAVGREAWPGADGTLAGAPDAGRLEIDPAEFDLDDAPGEVGPDELPAGASSGLLLHDVLEDADLAVARTASDANEWACDPDVAARLADAARARGVPARFSHHAAELAYATLTRPLALVGGEALPPMIAATALAREVEFGYPLPELPNGKAARGIVKGFIDALIAYDDDLWVLDYKSDALVGNDRTAAAVHRVREHYAIQARLYAIAADRLRGRRRFAGLLFAFVRYGIVVPVRVADDTLAAWVDWLARIAQVPQVQPPAGLLAKQGPRTLDLVLQDGGDR